MAPRIRPALVPVLVLVLLALATHATPRKTQPLPVAVPQFKTHNSPSMHPVTRSGSSKPKFATNCEAWVKEYEPYWQTFPHCHGGLSSSSCCSLYAYMDQSIRHFQSRLRCDVQNPESFRRKQTQYCSDTQNVSVTHTSVNDDAQERKRTLPPPVLDQGSHGTGKITILEEEMSLKTQCSDGNCCRGNSCYCSSCPPPPPPCHGQACQQRCQGSHCTSPCQGNICGNHPPPPPPPVVFVCQQHVNCNSVCQNNQCVAAQPAPQQPAPQQPAPQQPDSQQPPPAQGQPATCVAGVNCRGVCTRNGCIGIPTTQTGASRSAICFHGDVSVRLLNGALTRMRDVKIGDKVHVGFGHFSDVFMFTRRDTDRRASFVNVTVESGQSVMVTPGHFMYLAEGLSEAANIIVGSRLQMEDGRFENVASADLVNSVGVYNPQTMHGDIAVDGFRASTYTRTVDEKTAHALLSPLRALFRIYGRAISAAT